MATSRHDRIVRNTVVVRGFHPASLVLDAIREVVAIAVTALGTQFAAIRNAGHIALGNTQATRFVSMQQDISACTAHTYTRRRYL